MSGFPFSSFDFMFTFIPVIIGIAFVVMIGFIIRAIVKGVVEWNNNNNSPVLTVDVVIVAKRTNVSVHHNSNNSATYNTSSTTYYVTFEQENGNRTELKVSGKEYGLLVENDRGKLTFQGTRYKNFERSGKN